MRDTNDSPPNQQQKQHAQHQTRNFASHNIEPAENQQRPEQAAAQVPRRIGDTGNATAHLRRTALVDVQRNVHDAPARELAGEGVAELVEGDGLPFERLEDIADELDGEVPQDCDRDDVAAKDADGDLLGVRGEREGRAPEDKGWAGGEEGARDGWRQRGCHDGVCLGDGVGQRSWWVVDVFHLPSSTRLPLRQCASF